MKGGAVENSDGAATEGDKLLAFVILEDAADDFAGGAKFGGDFLVGDGEGVAAVLHQKIGNAYVNAAKGDFFDGGDDGGKPLCHEAEDVFAPDAVLFCPAAEDGGGDEGGTNGRFCHRQRWKMAVAQNTRRR